MLTDAATRKPRSGQCLFAGTTNQPSPNIRFVQMIHLSRKMLTASVALLLSLSVISNQSCAQDTPPAAPAPAAAAPTGPTPTLDQRVGILEAYLTNSDPTVPLKTAKDKDGNPSIPDGLAANSPTAANSGPGHNAWMMASSALVLFMTLPGLALFYAGLVRAKNVLSVMMHCVARTRPA